MSKRHVALSAVDTNQPRDASALIAALGRQIAAERTAAGHSLRDFSELSGVSVESLHRYEHGKRDIPYGTLQKIAAALNMRPSALMLAAEERAARDA